MNPTIAVLTSPSADSRIRVGLRSSGGGLQLISESFSSDIGWYVQSAMELEPEQLAALRALLGPQTSSRDVGGAPKSPPPSLSIHRAG